jgi:hypothetical protein
MKFITTAAALFALASTATAAFSSCGSSGDSFQLSSVSYTPNPPKVGQNVCITLNGSLAKQVTSGATIRVTATFCKPLSFLGSFSDTPVLILTFIIVLNASKDYYRTRSLRITNTLLSLSSLYNNFRGNQCLRPDH